MRQYLADGRRLYTADNTVGESRKLVAKLKNARLENSAKFHETNENVEELFRLHTDFQYTMQIPVYSLSLYIWNRHITIIYT